ncbi:MAG: hypothetical protein HRT35_03115 [Algicola sp.]|nr:hypothetical protein [Algicola sp.]
MLKTAIKHSIVASIFSLTALAGSSVAMAGELSSSFKSFQLKEQTSSTPKNLGPLGGNIDDGVNAPPGNYPCPINLCYQSDNPAETSCGGGSGGLVVMVQTTEEYCDAHGYNDGRAF